MSDYAKKKNDELAALCKERGLAHTGKKADLVKRLEESDASNSAAATTTANPGAAEDEIDWDEEPTATTEPAAAAVAAGGKGAVANPLAVPNQTPAIDPAQTDDLAIAPPAETDAVADDEAAKKQQKDADAAAAAAAEEEQQKKFGSGLAARTLEEEIEKRKARARKFGMPEDTDEIKALERAKRFGTTDLPGLLNRALPEKKQQQQHERKNREGGGGIRKPQQGGNNSNNSNNRRGGRPGAGRRQNSDRPKNATGGGGGAATGGGYPGWMTAKDRDAAERRKAKFTAA